MRYCLSIRLDDAAAAPFSFRNQRIRDFLETEKAVRPEPYISLATLAYERQAPGLLERNWQQPWYNDEHHFLFLAGHVLFRNRQIKGNNYAPTPREVLEILLNQEEAHHEMLKGEYCLVLLRKSGRQVDIYSSPLSLRPAFFSLAGGQLTFTNYLAAFRQYQELAIDKQGLVEFALFDHCLHSRTVYENVHLIPGGWHYRIAGGRCTNKMTYDVAAWHTPNPRPRQETLGEINAALKSAITNYVDSTGSLNVALTGGFDGRLNFSFIKKEDYPKIRAFSYGMPGSNQVSIPAGIARKLGFGYRPVLLSESFEKAFAEWGKDSILLSCGLTGFNRAVYPYAYNRIKDYSRSCLIGQYDMIRPIYNNPAGVIFNAFSRPLFYGTYGAFKENYQAFARRSFLDEALFTGEIRDAIYEEVRARHVEPYPNLTEGLRYFFFLLRESMRKYLHTEFHLADVFVDDFVSFADLDYLEVLFDSAYAGIYKGLFAKNQWQRRKAHDLYVDLMALNNDRLNGFYNDRFLKPGWLKYGLGGLALAAAGKQMAKLRNRLIGNDTFRMERWAVPFYQANRDAILEKSPYFDSTSLRRFDGQKPGDSGTGYRYNRMISLKLWLRHIEIN